VGDTYGSRRQYLQVDRSVALLALDSLMDHKKVHLYALQFTQGRDKDREKTVRI
jgi:hypothetical protein